MIITHKDKWKRSKLAIDTWTIGEIALMAKPSNIKLSNMARKVQTKQNWQVSVLVNPKHGEKIVIYYDQKQYGITEHTYRRQETLVAPWCPQFRRALSFILLHPKTSQISEYRKLRWIEAPWRARSSSWTTSKCSRQYFTNAQLKHPQVNSQGFGRQLLWKSLYKIKRNLLWRSLTSSSIVQQWKEAAGCFSCFETPTQCRKKACPNCSPESDDGGLQGATCFSLPTWLNG